jgi:hypothetical protein
MTGFDMNVLAEVAHKNAGPPYTEGVAVVPGA